MNRKRRVFINLAAFGLVTLVMVGWAVNQVVSVDIIENPYTIAADFPNAVGVTTNAEVSYLGVAAGSVSKVERQPNTNNVRVTMKIERSKQIPEGSSANIFRKSAIGEPYVDFEPPADYSGNHGPYYQPGTVVPMTHTTIALEFSELLRSASALVASISPDDVATLLHEASVGLNGRSDSLRQMTEAGDQLSSTLAARTEEIDRLIGNGTRLNHVLTEHREDLGQSLTDLRQVADTLRNAKGDTAVLLDRGSKLLTQTADLVAGQKGNLDCSLKVLEQLTDETSTDARQKQLRALLDIGPGAFAGVWDSRDVEPDGIWFRIGLVTSSQNPAPQFVPPKATPPVKVVPPCTSPLRPVTGTYRPASASHPLGGLDGQGPLGAVVVMVLIGAAASVAVGTGGLRSEP